MAADYAGAVAAIKQRFSTNWNATAFGFVNDDPPSMVDGSGNPTYWVLFEIFSAGSHTIGRGVPGNNVIIYDMLIKGHVFAPTGVGMGTESGGALSLALAIGELFRNQLFYNGVTPGCYVRSGYDANGQPRISDGDIHSNNGEWFTVTATIPAEFWTRA